MPSAEYWEGDPYLVRVYKRAHELRNEQRNQEMWLQGLYNCKAFDAVINMFSWGLNGKKGAKPNGYIEKPVDLRPKATITKEAFLEQWKERKAAWRAR